MTPEKLALVNLITRVGLRAALEIYEIIATAPTDADAIAALKKASIKTADDYVAEARARLSVAGGS
jgi:hypothetical protein